MSSKYNHYGKCPKCGEDNFIFIRNGIVSCFKCKKQFIKHNGKLIELELKSSNPDYKVILIDEYSNVNESKLDLSVLCHDNREFKSSFEKKSAEITDEVWDAGYSQDNPVPTYEPIKVGDSVYIFGSCLGIRLSKRGDNDNHIVMNMLCEDDGNWFLLSEGSVSTAWFDDIEKVMKVVKEYLNSQIPDMFNEIQFGWKFNDKIEEVK